jgi:quinol monooxygenase YgiN
MISVIASIRVKAGQLPRFIEVFKGNVANVREEDGCIEYFAALDVDAGLPGQELDEHAVTIIEKWRDVDALRAHLKSPHMLAYKELTRDLVESRSIRVLREA